jgi:hypothetical protein
LVRGSTSDFDKAALVADLKVAGFEDSLAKTIADHIDKKRIGSGLWIWGVRKRLGWRRAF